MSLLAPPPSQRLRRHARQLLERLSTLPLPVGHVPVAPWTPEERDALGTFAAGTEPWGAHAAKAVEALKELERLMARPVRDQGGSDRQDWILTAWGEAERFLLVIEQELAEVPDPRRGPFASEA